MFRYWVQGLGCLGISVTKWLEAGYCLAFYGGNPSCIPKAVEGCSPSRAGEVPLQEEWVEMKGLVLHDPYCPCCTNAGFYIVSSESG